MIERYGCNQCHTIERRLGVLTGEQLDRNKEMWTLPPNLYGEGNRVALHAAKANLKTSQRQLMQRLRDIEEKPRAGLPNPTPEEFFRIFEEVRAKYRACRSQVPEQMNLW